MQKAVTFASLSPSAMQLSAQAIMDSADINLLLWPDGHIATARMGGAVEVDRSLAGRPVMRIAQPKDHDALEALVEGARIGRQMPPVEIRHATPLPEGSVARYSACLAGDGMNVVLIGTWLSRQTTPTETSVEAEIASYQALNRQRSEARYRLLFEAATEGILFVDPSTGQVEEANGNAAAMLDLPLHDLVGEFFLDMFEDTNADMLSVNPVERAGDQERLGLEATVRRTGKRVRMVNRMVRTLDRTLLMIRVAPVVGDMPSDMAPREAAVIELLRRSAVGIVLSDQAGTASWCNHAFVSLLPGEEVIGRDIADVLGISQASLDIVLREVNTNGRALTSLSALDSRWVLTEDAHLTIVALPASEPLGYGFAVRMVHEESAEAHVATPDDSAIAELVGKAPMKYLVRESTDVIERNCIEAALRLTGNNRAAAAQVLGLSRQTLYAKINQHGLG